MSERFPHLTNNQSDFPNVSNVDVYQFDNDFDYARYDYTQMKITVCTVPWDMGEAHVGNRTIEGIGNVVAFADKSARDAWFAAIPDNHCFRFETKFKDLHRDGKIEVPLPFDIAARFNYVMVEYSLFANDGSPVQYENETGLRKWFWFIREVEFLSPNATRLHLMIDAWQTFIYDIEIGNMVLERGHAPLFATTVSQYLADPNDNCENLLAPDVNYGNNVISKHQSSFVFNDANMVCVVISSANPFEPASWGSKAGNDWNVHANGHFQTQGVPSLCAFAIDPANLSQWLFNIDATVPQFMQTIKAISFVASKLVTVGNSVTFAGFSIYEIGATWTQNDLYTIAKADFGYSANYADIAKLYTFPYAYIELTDESGNVSEIHIEDTNGSLKVESCVNLVFPWLKIDSHVTGVGKTARSSVTFTNVNARTMPLQGNWYEYVKSWNIPTFAVTQAPQTQNDYATHFDRAQQALAANNTYGNVVESADTLVDNADLTAATNTAVIDAGIESATYTTAAQTSYNGLLCDADNLATNSSATANIQAQEQQAAVAAASGAASGALGALGALATGNVAGAVGAIGGAIVGGAATMAQSAIGIQLTQNSANVQTQANTSHAGLANSLSNNKTTYGNNAQTSIAAAQNALTTGSAANSSAMQLANGTRDLNTATSAISNAVAQAGLADASEFGQFGNGDSSTTRPMGLFANIVTQNDYAIKRAGDEFARYGYMFNGQWAFDGNWNIGKYFTYWKCSDFWIKGLAVPDMYVDRIRFFLFGGVTVWSDPAAIGNVTIYQNLEV